MIEEEKYCVDVLKQTHAVRRAIQKIEALILEGHLHTHVMEGIQNGRNQEVLASFPGRSVLCRRVAHLKVVSVSSSKQ